ncbi:hypothetical protein EVAR_75758_1 [Eumeta japonica]|uniref:Uncharacterized protein n=1 Tax=Eumeta variegata TaxID=151549 RepID=A0A4C1TFX7_EUMVA|nr:hypothetical protein EVAR_75758_1 [Eumeta japonica]
MILTQSRGGLLQRRYQNTWRLADAFISRTLRVPNRDAAYKCKFTADRVCAKQIRDRPHAHGVPSSPTTTSKRVYLEAINTGFSPRSTKARLSRRDRRTDAHRTQTEFWESSEYAHRTRSSICR